jgi:hypothetical protein
MLSRRGFLGRASVASLYWGCYEHCSAEDAGEASTPVSTAELSNAEKVLFSTVRVLGSGDYGPTAGTGFLFSLFKGPKKQLVVIITNRHVVDAMSSCTFLLHKQNAGVQPSFSDTIPMSIKPLRERLFLHPTEDLAAIPIDPELNHLAETGTPPYAVVLSKQNIPNDQELNSLSPIEEVLTLGYPEGLSDPIHNLPIFHSGHTATPPYLPFLANVVGDPKQRAKTYTNEKSFLVDFTTWFGTSGSPVFIYNTNGFVDRAGTPIRLHNDYC